MKRQKLVKIFRWYIFFLILMIPLGASAQKYRRDCYLSEQARYNCFMQSYKGSLETAKTKAAERRDILQQQAAARPDLNAERNQRRERELQELRQIVEAALQRNITNEGKKYRINYGIVLEPRAVESQEQSDN
tara:strand:+ start:126 stop:524 length:399 start_codon:yes stop_codon:yes gene_type:complete